MSNINENCTLCNNIPNELVELDCLHNYCLKCSNLNLNKTKKKISCLICKNETIWDDSLFKDIINFNKSNINENKKKELKDKKKAENINKFKKSKTIKLNENKKLYKAHSFKVNNKIDKKNKINNKKNKIKKSISKNNNLENEINKTKTIISVIKSNSEIKENKTQDMINNIIDNINEESINKNILSSINNNYNKDLNIIIKDEEKINKNKDYYINRVKNKIKCSKNQINKNILMKNELSKTLITNNFKLQRYFEEIINYIKLFENKIKKEIKNIYNNSIKKINDDISNNKRNIIEYENFLEKITFLNDYCKNNDLNNKEYKKIMNWNEEEDFIENFESLFNNSLNDKIFYLNDINWKINQILDFKNDNLKIDKLNNIDFNINLEKINQFSENNNEKNNEYFVNLTDRLKKNYFINREDLIRKSYNGKYSDKYEILRNNDYLAKNKFLNMDYCKTINNIDKNNFLKNKNLNYKKYKKFK